MPHHILVIGGGPAGSLAARLLARQNHRVTLIESARFPRDKVCGECLSATGVDVLTRHGLVHRLRLRGAIDLSRTILHAPTGESCQLQLPTPMLGISREVMDTELLNAAREAGVEILQPARCESLTSNNAGVLAQVRLFSDNTQRSLNAHLAILADGKGALLGNRPAASGDFGLKAHFRNIAGPRDAIELFGVIGHYGGLAAVENNRWNASFSIPSGRLRQARGDLDRLFAEIVAENLALTTRFARATRAGDWHTSPLPRFAVARAWPANVIPIGNAAAAMEPIGGEGMGLALRSAELAAAAIAHGVPIDAPSLRHQYDQLWNVRRMACRTVARLMSQPTFAGPLLELATANDILLQGVMRLMGKREFVHR